MKFGDSTSEKALKIGAYCAEIIEDGATLQTGIGAIPDAVLASLANHKELGIHTEMFSDGIIPLIGKGILPISYHILLQDISLAMNILSVLQHCLAFDMKKNVAKKYLKIYNFSFIGFRDSIYGNFTNTG